MISNFKKAALMVAGKAVEKLAMSLAKEQEIIMNVADMLIDIYVGESMLLRIMKLHGRNAADTKVLRSMVSVFLADAGDRINKNGKDAIASFTEGDELNMLMMGLKRFTKYQPINVKEHRQKIAQKLIDKNEYCY